MDAETVLTTTRAVRRRLDLNRAVPRGLVDECVRVGIQAPAGGNRHVLHFVLVDDREKRSALGEIYARAFETYLRGPSVVSTPALLASVTYLAEHLSDVPVIVIPCMQGRPEERTTSRLQAGYWGSAFPAVWNFMLAARARGLGTVLTTMHLEYEQDAAAVLGIPYEDVTQVGLIPVAFTTGGEFSRARRDGVYATWNGWPRREPPGRDTQRSREGSNDR
jgi:nitroreductase